MPSANKAITAKNGRAASINSGGQKIIHQIPPVWNEDSRVLILGTMPSPKSRAAGFFYMHPQNRFWRVLPAVFGEALRLPNNAADAEAAKNERRQFLLEHKIALWDVLASCDIQGAADSSIKNAVPNDFSEIFRKAKIRRVFCAGQTAFKLIRVQIVCTLYKEIVKESMKKA